MKAILYLHGLASSPKGRKADLLAKRFLNDGYEVVAPDLNVPSFAKLSFDAIVERAAREHAAVRPAVIVGSSLGALVALALAHRIGIGPTASPLVLVAPALAFGERWRTKLPDGDTLDVFHFGEGRTLPVHRQFFEGMAAVAVEREPPPVGVSVVMGTDDESVPIEQVEATWKSWEESGRLIPGSRFHRVEGGDHSLLAHGDVIERALRERLAVS
ncbi:MAG: YqiA/YcfP family alpha/beta fold hydrolase [Thermoanaerobaculia bacterium]